MCGRFVVDGAVQFRVCEKKSCDTSTLTIQV